MVTKLIGKNSTSEYRRERPFYKTLHFKFYVSVTLAGLVLLFFTTWLLRDSLQFVVRDLSSNALWTSINFLEDELDDHVGHEAAWAVHDGALYYGDHRIGDGTPEHADLEIMKHCEEQTGNYFYIFMRTDNADELGESPYGYTEGPFIRVAGTTRNRDGQRLEGTYIDKAVSDVLEISEEGWYCTAANVTGRRIFTMYKNIYDADGEWIGILASGRSLTEIRTYINQQLKHGLALIIIAMIIMYGGLHTMIRTFVEKVTSIKEHLDRVGSGQFPEYHLQLDGGDELAEVAETINHMVDSLRDKERIGAELSVAAQIQKRLLPREEDTELPEEVDLCATMYAAKEIAGDFYDFFMTDDRHIVFLVGDVSGKGIPAALCMVRAKALIKSNMMAGLSPSQAFQKTNQVLCERNDEEFFVTAWMGLLNLETGVLNYVNAGHNPPLMALSGEDYREFRSRPNFVLAGLEGTMYEENTLQLKPGDRIFLYTDGVPEASDNGDLFYGMDRLREKLNEDRMHNADETVRSIGDDLRDFYQENESTDDITMLALTFRRNMLPRVNAPKEFEAEDGQLTAILDFTENELRKLHCPEKILLHMLVAVEEIFYNIAHYAYGGASGVMSLKISRENGDELHLEFRDYGIPFNPLFREDPKLDEATEDRKIGGLGIFMVKNFTDDIRYKHDNGQNVLELMIRLPEETKREEQT